MNILFYIPNLNKSSGGIYQYSLSVLEAVSVLDNHTFYVYHADMDQQIVSLINSKSNLILIKKQESKFSKKIRYALTGYNLLADLKGKKEFTLLKTFVDKLINQLNIDIVHSPFQFLPEYKTKTFGICTMHDVQELRFPEFFTPKERVKRALNYNRAITHSNKIIVSYEHIKNDIIKYFGKNKDDIHVCKISLNNLWFDKVRKVSQFETNVDLFDQFILYPAATWEHKNHITLLESLVRLNNKGIKVNLICTGHKKEYFKTIKKFITKHNLQSQVLFLGIVDEETLLYLYNHCQAVVIPTLYEAGSFPLMESILLNTPVICSDVTSLPETIGDKDFVFDPANSEDLTNKLELILFNEDFITKNKKNNNIQKQILLSNNFAIEIDEVYKEIYINDNK